MFKKKISVVLVSSVLAATALVGCGSGGSSSSSASSGTTSGVITGFGSVYVNGVEYETDGATFTIDGQPVTELDLDVGMVVTLEGSSSGTTGQATSVTFVDEVEGEVVANNIAVDGTLDVMGRTVIVDASTVFDADDSGIASADLLVAGNVVEISGYPGADGAIYATRIEVKAIDSTEYSIENPGEDYEMKGVVASLDTGAMTFMIGSLTVDYSSASSTPVLSDGLYVEVKSDGAPVGGVLTATEIEIEDDGEYGHDGEEGEDIEIQGIVTDISGLPNSFMLNGQTVLIGSSYSGEDDDIDPSTLTVGMEITIEAYFDADGNLVLEEIEEEDEANLELTGTVEAVDAAAGTITMFGITFDVTTSTMMMDESSTGAEFYFDITDISVGDYLEANIYHDTTASTFTATSIERDDSSEGAGVEGIVDGVIDTTTFTVAGITISWGGVQPLLGDEVEVNGTYSGGVLSATAVEIDSED